MDEAELRKPDQFHSDFLIIGSGLAGLYAALYASKFGQVALITKSSLEESNSYWAQGGIAAVMDPEDSILFHEEDTIKAGRGLSNIDAVEILVREGRERVIDLINLGMKFDSDEKGLELGLEGGHTRRRVLHAGGSATGREMVKFLISSVKSNPNISLFEGFSVAELLSDKIRCFGVLAYGGETKLPFLFGAKSTILATGGASALYNRTTNPPSAVGDGIALSYRGGAEIMDMEFTQFHPTALHAEGREGFLISEAVRGEGAYLLNQSGYRFMPDYHELAELAPRDVVSRAIFTEMRKSCEKCVFLSLRHLDPDFVKRRFLNIYDNCARSGIDITRDLVPVSPAAHYTIGGVKTGLMAETNVKGLFACGEVACSGVHGANRLASNSLLECIVFAKRAVDGAIKDGGATINPPALEEMIPKRITNSSPTQKEASFELKNKISWIMTENVGIVRVAEGLINAHSELERIAESAGRLSEGLTPKLMNMVDVALLMAKSALLRQESRGVHIREDFPDEDSGWKAHIVCRVNRDPVVLKRDDEI